MALNLKSSPAGDSVRHRWHFLRLGGLDQVRFRTGEDLRRLDELDEKLWVALSCPTTGLEGAADTLARIDQDGDQRVRAKEFVAAVRWATDRLKNPDILLEESDRLALSEIDDATEEGSRLLDAARAVLRNLGEPEATEIAVSHTAQSADILARARFNGDGVIPPSSAGDSEERRVLDEIVACLGGTPDRSGEAGVDRAMVEVFFTQAEAYLEWSGGRDQTIAPAAFEAYARVQEKLDDYFSRCQLVAYDARALEALDRNTAEFAALAEENLAALPGAIRELPLARPTAKGLLDLKGPLNPSWQEALADLRRLVLEPALGEECRHLKAADWEAIVERYASIEQDRAAGERFAVRQLPIARIEELRESDLRARIEALIERDLELAPEVSAVESLHQLLLYRRDLYLIARNLVSFNDFFSRDGWALFQAGTLYLDSRSCDLCVRVANPAAHAVLATLSRCYLLYCRCERAGQAPIHIAAMLSNGDSDDLMVGRNGVFYDRSGNDWHATVVKIVDNPISIRQAFWSPYKKFARFIDQQMTKRAEAAEKATIDRLGASAATVAQADRVAPPEPSRIEVGTVAAIGVALGSIGTFLSVILIRALELGPWLPLALLGLIFVISLPSMFLAWIRLRQRTLGPILDANGWAVNGRIKINLPLARFLTQIRRLPPGAHRDLDDPYGSENGRRLRWVLLLAALAGAIAATVWVYR